MLWTSKGFSGIEMEPHAHDMHELFFCLNDNGLQYAGGRHCAFMKGRAFFLYSGIKHHLAEHTNEKPGEFVFFCFDPNHFVECGMENIHRQIQRAAQENLFFSGDAPEYLKSNLSTALKLHEELNSNKYLSAEAANAMLAILVIEFFRSLKSANQANKSNQDEYRLKKLCSVIIENPITKMTLDHAAVQTAMSRAKFTQKFKSYTGMTFCEFVNDCRLKKACRLLEDKDISVSEAAFKTGFNNMGYFHRIFKDKFGHTPYTVKRIYETNKFPHFLKLS